MPKVDAAELDALVAAGSIGGFTVDMSVFDLPVTVLVQAVLRGASGMGTTY